MTPTMPDPITVTYADTPDHAAVVEAFAAYIAQAPSSRLYDLFVALMQLGVSMSIVESVLAHLEMAAD